MIAASCLFVRLESVVSGSSLIMDVHNFFVSFDWFLVQGPNKYIIQVSEALVADSFIRFKRVLSLLCIRSFIVLQH
jgi:hypothetical protein